MSRSAFVAALVVLAACGKSNSNQMTGPCGSAVNGCATFTDLTGGATATITFTSFAYTPRCAMVKVGQTVVFQGDFSFHPLSETCGPVDAIPHTTSGGTLSFSLATAGTYGYQCDAHHATNDMVGAIQVVP
jgi:plastocyanin